MLTIALATRTDSTLDPLTERALALTMEFMELTGRFTLSTFAGLLTEVAPQVHYQISSISSNHFNGSPLPRDPVAIGSMTGSWKSTVP